MNKKIVGILICMLLTTTSILTVVGTTNKSSENNILSSNISEVQWSDTYGGDEADKFWDVEETNDGGYIAVGTTEVSNIHYPWVLKVDSDGNEMWDWSITEFTVDGEVLEIDYCWQTNVLPISDGGYIISLTALQTNYNDETYEFGCIAKLSSEGDEEWINVQGDGFESTIRNEYFLEVEDGILGVGDYMSPPQDIYGIDTSGCFFKINNIGELVWHKEYDYGEFVDKLNGIIVTNDGGFLLAGGVGIVAEQYYDGWLVKTDSQGEKEWEKTYKGNKNDFFWGCIQTENNDVIMSGWTGSFGFGSTDGWILKTDSNGDEICNKTIGGKYYDIPYDIDKTDDGGFILPCIINFMGINTDNWIIKLDDELNVEWKHVYSDGKNYFSGICSTSDGGCIASGVLGGWDSSKSDALLVKYAPMENQRPNKPSKPSGPPKGEPDTEYTFTTSAIDPDGDSLTYMWDWGDGNYSDWLETSEASHTWTTEDNFKIRVMAKDVHGGESEWSDPFVFSTPKNKAIVNHRLIEFFESLIQRFPLFKKILNQIII